MRTYRIKALLLKHWYLSLNVFRLFDMFFWPVLGMIVFGFTALYFTDLTQSESLILFLLGGLLIWTIFERAQHDINIYILEDFWEQNIANTFLTPLRPSELVTALSITAGVRALLSTIVMYFVALIGYRFNLFDGGFHSVLFFIPLIIFGYAVGMIINALIFTFGQRVTVLVWSLGYLMQPIAGAFYPISSLPGWMQTIAHGTPLYYVFDGYRQSYAGNFSVQYFMIATVLALVYVTIGMALFMLSLHRARKKGLLANY